MYQKLFARDKPEEDSLLQQQAAYVSLQWAVGRSHS